MPQPTGYALLDLGGGINEGVSPYLLADREAEALSNFLPFGKKLIRRDGVDKLSTVGALSEDITGIFALKLSTGTWAVIVAASTIDFHRLDAAAFVALTNSDTVAVAAGLLPWSFVQYKDVGYAVRRNQGGMRRFSSTAFREAGIAAPPTAAALADGGAGAIEAGAVYGAFSFYNTATGAESNLSPVSPVLALGANRQIAWTSIDVDGTTGTQTNARRLYRTVPGAAADSAMLFVAQINDNVTTIFTDNVITASLDDPGEKTAHGLPPTLAEISEIHLERLFLSDGTDIFFSERGLPEQFDPVSVISISPDDGHEVRALRSYGDKLVVGKTNKVFAITGAGAEDFDVGVISDDHGCFSHHSMQVAGGDLIWYGGDNFYRSSGAGAVGIATSKLKTKLAAIPDSRKQYVVACVDPERDLYIVSYQGAAGSENESLLAYNYRSDSWAPLSISGGRAPAFLSRAFDSSFGGVIYSSFYDSHLYELFSGDVDDTNAGAAITATFKTKRLALTPPGQLASGRRAYILIGNAAEIAASNPNITLELYRDAETTPLKSRVVALSSLGGDALKRPWLGYNLSRKAKPGATLSLGLSYSGAPRVEIEGLALEALAWKRRVKVA